MNNSLKMLRVFDYDEQHQALCDEKLVNAIEDKNLEKYMDEIAATGDFYIPYTLPVLRELVQSEFAYDTVSWSEAPSRTNSTGLQLYIFFLNQAKIAIEKNEDNRALVLEGLQSDMYFFSTLEKLIKLTGRRSGDITYAQIRFANLLPKA